MPGLIGLQTQLLGKNFIYLEQVDSTNNYIKEHAQSLPDGTLVIAGRQYAGRGAGKHTWADGQDSMLAMSFLIKNIELSYMPQLPLITGLAVARALTEATGGNFRIKWANDVLYESKKLCGILCESQIFGDEVFAVCGIGINIGQDQAFFDRAGLPYATSLKLGFGREYSAYSVAALVMNHFEPLYERLSSVGFDALRNEYIKSCFTVGKQIRILSPEGQLEGLALTIDSDGSLVCNIDGKIVNIRAGEASVRGLYGYQ
ncbi:biotin--[acetyl-CoA-carboxylase] ligase [Candidatus Soleaferrea massiliensis]|uniref:biotin--[acetyl-CoA-carboxylase] ligase n=1 Tax=Candidatus Soleaferrea massiliensis TaxID=1470354 RepID=UPI00058DD215|nr:biotin--[acetyl-CoA-carboxylase] ligase [Candidatus Soleaferrea massiliensis]